MCRCAVVPLCRCASEPGGMGRRRAWRASHGGHPGHGGRGRQARRGSAAPDRPDHAVVVQDGVQRQVVRFRLEIVDEAVGKTQAHGEGARL